MLMHCLGKANSSVHFLNLTDFWQIRTSIEQKAAQTPLQNICLIDVCLDGLTLQSIDRPISVFVTFTKYIS